MAGRDVRRAMKLAAVCCVLALPGVFAVPAGAVAQPGSAVARGCAEPAVGQVGCAGSVSPGSPGQSAAAVQASGAVPAGYGPLDLRDAYGLDFSSVTGGVGQTVAVVTAYDDTSAQADMATYRSQY